MIRREMVPAKPIRNQRRSLTAEGVKVDAFGIIYAKRSQFRRAKTGTTRRVRRYRRNEPTVLDFHSRQIEPLFSSCTSLWFLCVISLVARVDRWPPKAATHRAKT